ncbi:MAG: rod shape-determining protein MreD [Rhodobacteraceae bacterium]|nr:rod shape-determining protein MreD [Paracoccaceae bacterium]
MAELSTSRLWLMRVGFVGLALLILFFHLLPLDTVPRRWAPPDLLVAFTFAWVLRRPDYVPVLILALVMLVADLMLQRPPGLQAMLMVLGCEYLKNQTAGLHQASFLGEWMAVGIVLVGITVLNRLILGILAVDPSPLGLNLIQMGLTFLVYPVAVVLSQSLMGVRKLAPGDADALGRARL